MESEEVPMTDDVPTISITVATDTINTEQKLKSMFISKSKPGGMVPRLQKQARMRNLLAV
jgi:hypothetical protein